MFKIKIFDEDGFEQASEKIGEIVATGLTITQGYYRMPNETVRVLKNNWFYTGDLGWFDRDGFLPIRVGGELQTGNETPGFHP